MLENRDYTVYEHITPSKKRYIGITCQPVEKRWGRGSGYNTRQDHFYRAILKYGWDNISHNTLLTGLTAEQACFAEKCLISFWNTMNEHMGYNTSPGGYEGRRGIPHTLESRRKMSEAQLGEKNHQYGKHCSEETKRKMSEAHLGRKKSPETRKRISESRMGIKYSLETLQRMSDAHKGKKLSPESVRKREETKRLNRELAKKEQIS